MSELERRLREWNEQARERIDVLREREESRELVREFVAGVGALARELWEDVGKEALKALAVGLVTDAVDRLEK